MTFLEGWFGAHAGREVLVLEPFKDRVFIEKPEQLEAYVQECKEKRLPAFCSVQPFQARDQPFGLEKLFFEFDCKGKHLERGKTLKPSLWLSKSITLFNHSSSSLDRKASM